MEAQNHIVLSLSQLTSTHLILRAEDGYELMEMSLRCQDIIDIMSRKVKQ